MDYHFWKGEEKDLSASSLFDFHNREHVIPNQESDPNLESEDPERQELIANAKKKDKGKKATEKTTKEKKATGKTTKEKKAKEKKDMKGTKRPVNDETIEEQPPAKKKKETSGSQKEWTTFNYMDMNPKAIENFARKEKEDGTIKYYIPLRFHYEKNPDEKYIMVPDEIGNPGKIVWIEYSKNFDRDQFEQSKAGNISDDFDKAATIENQIMEDPTKFMLIDMKSNDKLCIATELNRAVKNVLFDHPTSFIEFYHANATKELLVVSPCGSYRKTGEYKK